MKRKKKLAYKLQVDVHKSNEAYITHIIKKKKIQFFFIQL